MSHLPFDHALCLTHDRRLRQYQQEGTQTIVHQLSGRGIVVERFLAGDGSLPGMTYDWIDQDRPPRSQAFNYASCLLTCLRRMEEAGWRRLLYLEDDALLTPHFDLLFPEVCQEIEALERTPGGFDLYYLGGNHGNGYCLQVGDFTIRTSYTLDLHAVIIHRQALPQLLAIEPSSHHTIDGVIAERQRTGRLRVFAAHPCLITQRSGWSFNEGRHDDKSDRHWV